jgi:hypothetical protein
MIIIKEKILFWRTRKINQRVRSECRKALRVDLLKNSSMKNFLKFVLVVCLMFAITDTQAQMKFGPKVGLNLSTMTLKTMGISFDPKTLVGFNVGVVSEITLSDNLSLQPSVLYSAKGSKYSITILEVTTDFEIAPSFIEIPVNAVYKFDLGSSKLFLNAGPYFAYGIGGKSKSGGESSDISFGSGENNDMKPFDFGLNFGAGIEIANLLISANYEFGLTNLAPITTDNTEMKVKVIGFSVAYLFGGKK